jgi:hypothetical protein
LAWFVENGGYYSSPQTINKLLGEIDWNTWKYAVGSDPSGTLNFTTTNSMKAQQLAQAYVALQGNSSPSNYQ